MSVDLLRQLVIEEQVLTGSDLAVLLGNLSSSGAHRYLAGSELSYGKLKSILRFAGSDRVREVFFADLHEATGYTSIKLPTAADLDGDGDVDIDDALEGSSEVISHANTSLRRVIKQRDSKKRVDYSEARAAMQAAAEQALTAVAIFDFLASLQDSRHRLKGRGLVGA
ncbi:MAG: hypothetical protein AAF711_00545 [Planctomycetota bacterium]